MSFRLLFQLSFFISAFSAEAKTPAKFEFSLKAQPTEEVSYIPHTEDKPMGSYLTMNLDYGPFAALKKQLEIKIKKNLKDRGEAHITVISPIEYNDILKKHLKIEAIQSIALLDHIQKSDLKYLCIGRGQIEKNGKTLETYYVVVKSKHLLEIRQKIYEAFLQAGGDKKSFAWNTFYPHVTLGFTNRDLHLEDGVKKDSTSCIYNIKK